MQFKFYEHEEISDGMKSDKKFKDKEQAADAIKGGSPGNAENQHQNKHHNSKKEALGPNTKR